MKNHTSNLSALLSYDFIDVILTHNYYVMKILDAGSFDDVIHGFSTYM